jgi:hypothetical protein
MEGGVAIEGICLYPILDCVGWEGNRVCPVGLFSEADDRGTRAADRAFQEELLLRQACVRKAAPVAGRIRRSVMEPQA